MSKAIPFFNRKQLAVAVSAAILTACGGSSGGGDDDTATTTPTPTPAATYTLSTAGGNGGIADGGYGGDADDVYLYTEGDKGGIQVLNSGSADASFTSQIGSVTPFLGTRPLEVTADTTVIVPERWTTRRSDGAGPGTHQLATGEEYLGTDNVLRIYEGASAAYVQDPVTLTWSWTGGSIDYAADTEVSDGRYYTYYSSDAYVAVGDDNTADPVPAGAPYFQSYSIYLADGDDSVSDQTATGLSVASGATLTLELNDTYRASFDLDNDIVNHGTITTADYTSSNRGDLYIYPDGSLINYGTITTAGNADVPNGGEFYLWAAYSAFNAGTITTAGGDSSDDDGGYGERLDFNGAYYAENTGTLDISGGDGASGYDGGNSSYVDLYSEYGSARNSGSIISAGGDGDWGGDAGSVYLYNYYAGDVLNSGTIDASGGTGSAGDGGEGGYIDFEAYGGMLISSGNINAVGGDASSNEQAGDGGDLYATHGNGYASWGYGTTPQGGIEFSGDILLTGGNSTIGDGDGGSGGYFNIYTYSYENGYESTTGEKGITLYGYSTIDASGGDAQHPGDGDYVEFYADYGWDDSTYEYTTGPVINQADILASAGAYTGSSDSGSNYAEGGYVNMETAYYYADHNPATRVINSGNIDVSGADGLNITGNNYRDGGDIWMWGYHGVDNSGAITANGGSDLSADGDTTSNGSDAGYVELYAELGPVTNSGVITASGGDAEYDAGDGSDWAAFYGPSVSNSGTITVTGGDADSAITGNSPGYGGYLWMMGSNGPESVSNSGTITVAPGAGYSDVYDDNGYYKVIGATCSGDC